jgi:Carboxypeptidase regulatory-like domain
MRSHLPWLSFLPLLAWGQSYTSTVRGTITDSQQAAVPAAIVVVTEVNRNVTHTTKSDNAGRYTIPALPPGSYSLSVEAPGFQKYEKPAFQLEVQQEATVDIQLSVAGTATTVEVNAAAELLNTANATLGQVIENRFMTTAPLVDRTALSLVMLTPGVVPSDNEAGGTASTNFVANGTRNATAQAMLDGTVVTGMEQNGGITDLKYQPSVDVVQEFKVQTNFFNAEFGNTGGAIVNIVTKSGTNNLHGVVYDFERNSGLNANNWFSNQAGVGIPDFQRHVFGGTVGGPVYLPRIYNGKNRTFFFFDFEGTRQTNATQTLTTVPTALQRKGDFSQTFNSNGKLAVIYNPFDTYESADGDVLRRPFAGNIIPASMQTAIAQKILSYYPQPTSDGNPVTHSNNFFAQGANETISNQLDGKIDQTLGEKQRLMGRYSVNWGHSNPANLLGNIAGSNTPGYSRSQNFLVDYTRTHSPSTIFQIRVGELRVFAASIPASDGFDATTLGFPNVLQQGGVFQFPNFSISGYRGLGAGGWSRIIRGEEVRSINGSVTKIIQGHTIKAGAERRFLYENYFQPGYPGGGFNFSRQVTGQDPLSATSSQGNSIASMLVGWGQGGYMWWDHPVAASSGYFGTFVQDDWRISPRLTLNIGLRYEFNVPRTERFDRLDWFDYGAASPLAGKVPASPDCPACSNLRGVMNFVGNGHSRTPFDGDYNNIGPRIGVAYALGRRMSIRAAYGIFYSENRNGIKGEVGPSFRSSTSVQWSRDGGITPYASLANPYPDGLTPAPGRNPLAWLGHGVDSYIPSYINPNIQQWLVSIQREVPGNGVVEINYSASKGTHLYFGGEDIPGNHNLLSPAYWGLGRAALNDDVPNPFYGIITDPTSVESQKTVPLHYLLRPYPQYAGGLGEYNAPPNTANSIYHSLQFKYEKRFSKGLAVLAHYTFSKLISDTDESASDVSWLGGLSGVQNPWNLRLERSVATFDIPHRAVFTFDYQLPFGRGRTFGKSMNRLADAFLGGWEVSAILTFSSGYPIVPGLDSSDLWDGAAQRPNLIANPCTSGSVESRMNGTYFNENAFTQPDQDVWGNAPRTLGCRTPGIRNGDVVLMKNFHFTESRYLQLRMESFNVTNTPTFGRPDSNYGSNTFGVIDSYAPGRGPREIQIAAKFYF